MFVLKVAIGNDNLDYNTTFILQTKMMGYLLVVNKSLLTYSLEHLGPESFKRLPANVRISESLNMILKTKLFGFSQKKIKNFVGLFKNLFNFICLPI